MERCMADTGTSMVAWNIRNGKWRSIVKCHIELAYDIDEVIAMPTTINLWIVFNNNFRIYFPSSGPPFAKSMQSMWVDQSSDFMNMLQQNAMTMDQQHTLQQQLRSQGVTLISEWRSLRDRRRPGQSQQDPQQHQLSLEEVIL